MRSGNESGPAIFGGIIRDQIHNICHEWKIHRVGHQGPLILVQRHALIAAPVHVRTYGTKADFVSDEVLNERQYLWMVYEF